MLQAPSLRKQPYRALVQALFPPDSKLPWPVQP